MRSAPPLGLMTIVLLVTTGISLRAAEGGGEWRPLFDGKTLEGWATTGKPEGWGVEDGAIACLVSKGGYLYTKETFEDFALSLEFKVSPPVPKVNPKTKKEAMAKCNSGVFIRWSDLKDAVHTGIEVQVYDSVGAGAPGKHDCGAIYDMVAPTKNVERPVGEWNRMVITCKGPMITVELNGEKICAMDQDQFVTPGLNPDGTNNKFKFAWKTMPRKGHIGFQDHGHRVWFRDVKIKVP